MLTIFLDTQSLKMTSNNVLNKLLSLKWDPFIFFRTEHNTTIEKLYKIKIKEKQFNEQQEKIKSIYSDLNFYLKIGYNNRRCIIYTYFSDILLHRFQCFNLFQRMEW